MIKYGKTKQFRDVIRDLAHTVRFKGVDEQGTPIYSNEELPVLSFRGTVKLHGTNAGISHHPGSTDVVCMSRNNVVTQGHFGFPEMILQEKDEVLRLIDSVRMYGNVGEKEIVSIYGEWVGEGVQKGVAISGIPRKTWFIFAIKITDVEGNGRWLQNVDQFKIENERIRNIHEFPTVFLEIDLNNPALIQNQLIDITNKVEAECPVAKEYGVSGVGEGVVWETWYKGMRFNFKVKGEKHSSSKVKKLAPVDPEKAKSVSEFIDYAITVNRVKQAIFEVAQQNDISEDEMKRNHTGAVLKWIANDVIEEETEAMKNSMLEWKDVGKQASEKARRIFFEILDNMPI